MNATSRTLKVLLVEDDPEDYYQIRRMVSHPDASPTQIEWAETLEQAKQLIQNSTHDVYLVDSRLGPDSGTELLQELTARHRDKPVILLTGLEAPQMDEQALKMGAADYLVKGGFNGAELMRSIRYAIARKENEVALRKNTERLSTIIATQQEIAMTKLEANAIMSLTCERAQTLSHADGAIIDFVEGDELVYRAASGLGNEQLGTRLKLASSLSGLCVRTGEIMYCEDTLMDARVDRESCLRIGVRSLAVAPLVFEGKTIGILKVLSQKPGNFDETDSQALLLMAGLTATALARTNEFESKQKLIRELREAIANVKTLGGLLPICSNCKKIRDDKGYWNQIELFIRDRSNAKFSHGICPDCAKAMFGDMLGKGKEKGAAEAGKAEPSKAA